MLIHFFISPALPEKKHIDRQDDRKQQYDQDSYGSWLVFFPPVESCKANQAFDFHLSSPNMFNTIWNQLCSEFLYSIPQVTGAGRWNTGSGTLSRPVLKPRFFYRRSSFLLPPYLFNHASPACRQPS